MSTSSPQVLVVGGGPSGLAAAFRLARAGVQVRVLEAGDRVGGKMRTTPRDGFLVDQGAFFLPTTHRTLLSLATQAGMADEIVPGGFVLGTARDRQIHDLDGQRLLWSALSTRMISTGAKFEALKLAPEMLKARDAVYDRMALCGRHDTTTLAEWGRSRFSLEVQEYILDTVLRGIFATSAATAPRVDFLAILSLLKGARLVAFRGGMGSYAERIAAGLDVRLGTEVLSVEQRAGRVTVTCRDRNGTFQEEASACIVAVPAIVARAILPGLDTWRRTFLQRVRHGKAYVLNVGLHRAPANAASTYILVPRGSHSFVTGIMLDHHKAPGRAPVGKGLLSVAVLDTWGETHWEDDDDSVRDAILQGVEQLLPGSVDDVEFLELHRWFQEYNTVGFYQQLADFRSRCEADDRIQLAGDFHSMQNLDAATTAGLRAADRLLARGLHQ